MHKKSVETTHSSPGRPGSMTPPPTKEKAEDQAMEEEREEKHAKDASLPISKEALRESSIAALRAKAQEHSAKMLSTVSDRTDGHVVTHKEEAADKATEVEREVEEKSN